MYKNVIYTSFFSLFSSNSSAFWNNCIGCKNIGESYTFLYSTAHCFNKIKWHLRHYLFNVLLRFTVKILPALEYCHDAVHYFTALKRPHPLDKLGRQVAKTVVKEKFLIAIQKIITWH